MAAGGRSRTGLVVIMVAFILLIIVGALYWFVIRPTSATPTPTEGAQIPQQELVSIVISAQAIPRGKEITADLLTTIKLPKEEVPVDTFYNDIVEVVGKKVKYNIDARVPITRSLVMEEMAGSLASADIPAGMTAFSIPITAETAISYGVQQWDHVMVNACVMMVDLDPNYQTISPNYTAPVVGPYTDPETGVTQIGINIVNGGPVSAQGRFEVDPALNQPVYVVPSELTQRPRLVCQMVIADAVVLKVGTFEAVVPEPDTAAAPVEEVAPDAGGATPTPTVSSSPQSITLIVNPQDTVILNYLLLSGAKISLALRGAGDSQAIITDPVTLQYIMDSKNIPVPAKLPYGMEPRLQELLFPAFNPTAAPATPQQ